MRRGLRSIPHSASLCPVWRLRSQDDIDAKGTQQLQQSDQRAAGGRTTSLPQFAEDPMPPELFDASVDKRYCPVFQAAVRAQSPRARAGERTGIGDAGATVDNACDARTEPSQCTATGLTASPQAAVYLALLSVRVLCGSVRVLHRIVWRQHAERFLGAVATG